MRKENEKKFNDERSKSEKEYKKEIEKMQQQLSVLSNPFRTDNPFNDSAILANEAQKKFVISLFVNEVYNAKAIRIYRAT